MAPIEVDLANFLFPDLKMNLLPMEGELLEFYHATWALGSGRSEISGGGAKKVGKAGKAGLIRETINIYIYIYILTFTCILIIYIYIHIHQYSFWNLLDGLRGSKSSISIAWICLCVFQAF